MQNETHKSKKYNAKEKLRREGGVGAAGSAQIKKD